MSTSHRNGLMVVYSPSSKVLQTDLALARSIHAACVEVLPRWNALPDPGELRKTIDAENLRIWSVHGPWGGQTIQAYRVDLADVNPRLRQESLDDVRRAMDWTAALGAEVMVVHPGGLSAPEALETRTEHLTESLSQLAEEAERMNLRIGVENMPRGVYPGSAMADLTAIVERIGRPGIGLVLDTGHAMISGDLRTETIASKGLLISTHVHENDGRADSHRPPGEGAIDWPEWFETLDRIGYTGPIMLECVRALRESPEPISRSWVKCWNRLVEGAGDGSETLRPFDIR